MNERNLQQIYGWPLQAESLHKAPQTGNVKELSLSQGQREQTFYHHNIFACAHLPVALAAGALGVLFSVVQFMAPYGSSICYGFSGFFIMQIFTSWLTPHAPHVSLIDSFDEGLCGHICSRAAPHA